MGQQVIVVVSKNNYRMLLAIDIFMLTIFGVKWKQKAKNKNKKLNTNYSSCCFLLQFVE